MAAMANHMQLHFGVWSDLNFISNNFKMHELYKMLCLMCAKGHLLQ